MVKTTFLSKVHFCEKEMDPKIGPKELLLVQVLVPLGPVYIKEISLFSIQIEEICTRK